MHNQSTPPTISVIVPVYNAEKYLHRCIDSVLAQTYTDFELLLIDDGSMDRSGQICDEYAAKGERIRVFHKENGGVSSARNIGLDNAQGEWVTFVDADDYIEENFLKSFEGKLDADMVVGNAVSLVCNTGEKLNIKNILSGSYQDVSQVLRTYLQELILRTPWGKMYRTSIIADLRFDERLHLGEDTLFNLCYFRSVACISVIVRGEDACYVYKDHDSLRKYETSVRDASVCLSAIGEAYNSLSTRCVEFEKFIVEIFWNLCVNDMPLHSWYW